MSLCRQCWGAYFATAYVPLAFKKKVFIEYFTGANEAVLGAIHYFLI